MTPTCATIITVDDDGIADFSSIQSALDFASNGDIIIVQPGLYDEHINFLGKNVTLTSTNPANPDVVANTIIDYDNEYESTVMFLGTEEPNCVLTGFNINGSIVGFDWMIDPAGENHTHATISNCLLQGNCGHCGIVIYGCDGIISNCLVAENGHSHCSGGCPEMPFPTIGYCHGLIKNCTIANNHTFYGIEVAAGEQTTIENCVIWGNYGHGPQICVPDQATVNIRYTDIQGGMGGIDGGGTANWGPGNIDTDPCFVREGYWEYNERNWILFEGDYHLRSLAGRWDPNTSQWVIDVNTSDCIDAGNPGCPPGGETAPNGNRINIGAYGGTATASKSPTDWRSIADLTNDYQLDFNDLDVFSNYWLDGGDCIPSDLNRNQSVDFTDFAIFAENWLYDSLPILTDADIILELEYLETINTYPENLNIDPNDYPIVLGRYSENWLVLIEKYFCSDVCPDYGRVVLIYEDITSEEDCAEIGGVAIIDPAWGSYIGCAPDVE